MILEEDHRSTLTTKVNTTKRLDSAKFRLKTAEPVEKSSKAS